MWASRESRFLWEDMGYPEVSHLFSCEIKQTLSEPLTVRLHIKRKCYREDVCGTITKWWHVVRGAKSDIELQVLIIMAE